MKNGLFWLIFLLPIASLGFVISKSDAGHNVRWNRLNKELVIYYNMKPVNDEITLDISPEQLSLKGLSKSEYIKSRTEEILQETVLQWRPHITYQILLRPTERLPAVGSGQNSVRYSSDSRFFGSGAGVIGVTSMSFNTVTGDILSASILMNQGITGTRLTLDKSLSSYTNAYVGDILTHEFGHFFGLSHSEVIGSSMVFSVFKGQHSIHEDDIAGVRKNYGVRDPLRGSLSGRVVADKDAKGIFGVNVNLISMKKNRIVQSQLSNKRGHYFFDNLDLNDSYYVRLEPLKKVEDISPYFSTVSNSLCGNREFRGTFFTKCGASSQGKPQVFAIKASRSFVDMGNLSIRCDENVNPYYYANKFKSSERQTNLLEWRQKSGVHYGLFSSSEIIQGVLGAGDEYSVDLRSLNPGVHSLGVLSLRLGVMSSGLGSNFDVQVLTKKSHESVWMTHNSITDGTGKLVTDRFIDLKLSNVAQENLFEIKVLPIPLTIDQEIEIFSAQKSRSDSILNDTNLYTLSVDVGILNGQSMVSLERASSLPYEDNKLCLEGEIRFPAAPFTTKSESSNDAGSSEDEILPVGCGSIDLDSNNSNGPKSFILGLIVILSFAFKQDIKDKLLSKS